MRKKIILSIVIGLTLVLTAHAQTSSTPTVEELQKQIQLLLSQIGSLQKEVSTLKTTPGISATTPVAPTIQPTTSPTPPPPTIIEESEVTETETAYIAPPVLARSLFRGSRGDDVRQLQEFLAQDPAIYPEGIITGYYGIGTEAAVRKWQARYGLPAVGVIGRQTIAKFKEISKGTVPIAIPTPTKPTLIVDPFPTKPEPTKPELAVCPALPTVDSCPAGEERIVTYKSERCGVYYACKPRPQTRAENTLAVLKKASTIQSDNRYSLNIYDPEGVQKFTVYNTKGANIHYGYPACRKEWNSPVFSASSDEFPLKLVLADCSSGQTSIALDTPVVVKGITEGLTFPYTFSNGKVVNSSDDARSYCYANGPGSGGGVAAECETKFGVVYTQVTTTTTTSSGRAIYLSDSFAACMTKYGFNADAKQIKTWAQSSEPIPWSSLSYAAQNTVQKCESEYYGQATVETGAAMCSDGKDNDGDGFIDAADPSCAGSTTTTTTTTTTSSGQSCDTALTALLGTGCHYMYNDSANNPIFCDGAMTKSAKRGATTATTGCTAPTSTTSTYTPPSGQKEQVWNSLGLRSWIRTDADSGRIEQLKAACASVPNNSNIWLPNAGTYSSADFGLPDATKCQRASACTSSQYFDGAACVAGTSGTQWQSGTTGTSCDSALTALLGTGCHYMYNDSASNQIYCDGPMTKSAKRGDTTTTSGCASSSSTAWPIDQASCTAKGYNWCTSSSSWCQSTTCPTSSTGGSTYAGDANSCPGFAYSRWDSSSRRYCQLNNETRCDYNYPSYLTNGANYTAANCPTTSATGGSDTSTWCSPLGSGWSVYGNYCLNSSRTQYTSVSSPSLSSVQSCTGADSPVTGCTPPGGGTTSTTSGDTCSQYGSGWHSMSDGNCYDSGMTNYRTANGTLYSCSSTPATGCSSWASTSSGSTSCGSGQYWNGTSCVASTSSGSCGSGQYWNGSSCVTSTTSTTNCSTPSNCYDSSVCASSGWYWYNGGCWSSPQSSTTSSSSTSCASGQYWNGSSCVSSSSTSSSSTSCGTGQYWNGSSCVSSTSSGSTSSCPSGQYWNGTACVTSTTPSASAYDQMKIQLKAIEIILKGLLGR